MSRAVGLGVTIFIARFINVEVLGFYGIGRKFQELTKLVTTQGSGALLIKKEGNISKDILSYILVNSLVVQTVLLVISFFVNEFFFLLLIPGVILVSITKYIELYLVSQKKQVSAAFYISLISDIPLILALILYQIMDVNVSINILAITLTSSYVFSAFKINIYEGINMHRFFLKKYLSILKLSFAYFMPRLNGVLLTSLNVVIVAQMLNVESSGYFNTALRLATISNMVLIAFVSMRAPQIASNFRNKHFNRITNQLKLDMLYLSVVGCVILCLYIFLAP